MYDAIVVREREREADGEVADIVGDNAVHPHLHGAHAPAIRSIQRCFTVYITVLLCT